jgi:hypothetical protein
MLEAVHLSPEYGGSLGGIGETGTITDFNQNAQTITLKHTYQNPAIFAQPLSFNGGDPAIVRIENILSDRFTAYLQEPNYKDGTHTAEQFSYLVLEAGTWQLENGSLLEVGLLNTDAVTTESWETVNFSQDFGVTPLLFSQVQTNNERDFVRTRQQSITADGFQVAMEEEDALRNSGHSLETIGWFAISPGEGTWNGIKYQAGNTPDRVTDQFYTVDFSVDFLDAPNLLAAIATYDGSDSSGLRYKNLTNNRVQIKVEEDQSLDNETQHTTEVINFLALDGSGLLTGLPMSTGSSEVLTLGNSQPSANIIFPDDAGVINVTSYGAVPDDGQDDTTAIQQALNENPTGNHIFYFPNGVYDISTTLSLSGSQKRNIFQGQSEDGTILRLMDSVSSSFDGAIINFGPRPAQRFRNALRNMTVSIGTGHPNAVGVQFNASNQGTMQDVTIVSEDGQGRIGLDMSYTDEVGPLLIKGVTVEGFDYGIFTRWPTASQTFEDITLQNQNIYGWLNRNSQRVFVRNLQSTNEVTAIRNDGEAGFVLIDSTLTGIGTASSVPAIINQKSMYVGDTSTTGYKLAVDSIITYGRGNPDLPIGYIDEYLGNGAGQSRSGGPFELFPSPDQMLGLPVQESPEVSWETDLSKWDGPHRYLIGNSGIPNDGIDDTPSIQAAIDSGATTIYLPRGTWDLNGAVQLGNNVRRFLGTEALLEANGTGKIQVIDGLESTVVIERLEIKGDLTIEHESDRTLLLNNLLGSKYVSTVPNPGDVFINDSLLQPSIFRNQTVWARQLNMEGDTQSDPTVEAKLLNDNANVWILGLKTEDEGTVIKTINGGSTELYGTLHVGSGTSNEANPRFVTIDSSFSAAGVYGGGFSVWASETRNGETRVTDNFNFADAYVAYPVQ